MTEAIGLGEMLPLESEVTAMALYGAARSAGEFVIAAADRRAAVPAATRTLDSFIDGLATPAAEKH